MPPASADAHSVGCIGWNPPARRAVCITGESSIQQGDNLVVEELGGDATFDWLKTPGQSFDAAPSPAAVTRLRALLAAGAYTALPAGRTLAPGEAIPWPGTHLVFRYARQSRPDVETDEGSWSDVTDRIEIDCGAGKRTLFEREIQGAGDGPAILRGAAQQHLVLVEWAPTWALEGDSGGAVQATLIDTAAERCADP